MKDFVKQIYKGKTIYRILFNEQVQKYNHIMGNEILDLAGGKFASYYEYLPKKSKIYKTNRELSDGVDFVIDISNHIDHERQYDTVFLFNSLYVVKDPVRLLADIKKLIRDGGKFFLCVPYISQEMPEPNDYFRLTREGIEEHLIRAGFKKDKIKIIRFGERFTSAIYLINPFFVFNTVRLPIYFFALLFDKLIPSKIIQKHPCPLGYFCIVEKD